MKTTGTAAPGGGGPAVGELSELRKAITAQWQEPAVHPAALAMMGELLQRLESFEGPPRPDALRMPDPPSGREPSLSESARSLHGLRAKLSEQFLTGGESGKGALQAMASVIDNYLAMRAEVMARCASESEPA